MHRSIALRLSRAMLVRRVGAGPLHVGPFRGFLLSHAPLVGRRVHDVKVRVVVVERGGVEPP